MSVEMNIFKYVKYYNLGNFRIIEGSNNTIDITFYNVKWYSFKRKKKIGKLSMALWYILPDYYITGQDICGRRIY